MGGKQEAVGDENYPRRGARNTAALITETNRSLKIISGAQKCHVTKSEKRNKKKEKK